MLKENDYSIAAPLIAFSAILVLLAVLLLVFISIQQKKKLIHAKEKKLLQSRFQQELLQTQIEIQEQTLQQISRELHDNLGQVASLIKINLNTLKIEDTEKAIEKIESTKDLTRQLISDIKTLSVSLSSDRIAQTGLPQALQTEVDRLNKTGLFTADFIETGLAPTIENDTAIILYRMAQELLNNMVKHSHAKQITVQLTITESLFILAFSDDGQGFDVAEKMNSGGAGLTNLHKRATLIKARLSIQSSPGNGSQAIIELPL